MAGINETLEKMELDYLDMMIIHSPQPWAKVNQCEDRYVEGNRAAWKALEDAYMAGKEAEEYNPIQKHHHSTVKFVAELCKELNVKNVIMSHTVDTDLENRKKLFTEDAHKYYGGNVFVPDDLEVIEIK